MFWPDSPESFWQQGKGEKKWESSVKRVILDTGMCCARGSTGAWIMGLDQTVFCLQKEKQNTDSHHRHIRHQTLTKKTFQVTRLITFFQEVIYYRLPVFSSWLSCHLSLVVVKRQIRDEVHATSGAHASDRGVHLRSSGRSEWKIRIPDPNSINFIHLITWISLIDGHFVIKRCTMAGWREDFCGSSRYGWG